MIKKPDFVKAKAAGTGFFIFEAKIAFFNLQKAFTKTPILHYIDFQSHIRIETDASGYIIRGVFS